MLSFDNTEIAFASKNNKDLNRSYWLFKLIGNPLLVSIGKGLTGLALGIHFPIRPFIKPTIFRQFCGGENISECERTIEALGRFGIGTILDYSVEGKETESDFDRTAQETIATIKRAANDMQIPFSVFKITGLARFGLLEKASAGKLSVSEQQEFEKVRQRVQRICKEAHGNNVKLFIDAEESWVQPAMDDLANEMMRTFNKEKPIVYNTFQLYRKDRFAYLRRSYESAVKENYFLGAKLVRGAYMEKERKRALDLNYQSPIQDSKLDADRDYDESMKFCIDHIDRIGLCAGTHNEKSSMYLTELMKQKGIPNNHAHVYFSQLLGMSDHISYNLAKAGYNVAKYVPYGPVRDVVPYLIRRAQENTSVKGQTGRELSLIIKEKKRRREKK